MDRGLARQFRRCHETLESVKAAVTRDAWLQGWAEEEADWWDDSEINGAVLVVV